MENYIRKYNYIKDYYETVYDLYAENYPGYPVTYYALDNENSVMDRENLMAGAYERQGVGKLSGFLWRKISMLPVFGIEQIQPTQDSGEKGLTYQQSENTQISFPSKYNFRPSENDIIHFSQEFLKKAALDIKPLFVVSNVNLATYGEITMYQCVLKPAPFSRDELEKQISSYWMFMNLDKKIHRADNAQLMLRLQNKSEQLSDRLRTLFHDPTGTYLEQV